LYYEMQLAVHLGLVDVATYSSWASKITLDAKRYPVNDDVLQAMANDKKNYNQLIVFELPCGNYQVKEVALTMDEVRQYVVC